MAPDYKRGVAIVFVVAFILGVVLVFCRLNNWFGRRASKAEKLLDDIMSGKERDVSKIEAEWKEFLAEENRKKAKSRKRLRGRVPKSSKSTSS